MKLMSLPCEDEGHLRTNAYSICLLFDLWYVSRYQCLTKNCATIGARSHLLSPLGGPMELQLSHALLTRQLILIPAPADGSSPPSFNCYLYEFISQRAFSGTSAAWEAGTVFFYWKAAPSIRLIFTKHRNFCSFIAFRWQSYCRLACYLGVQLQESAEAEEKENTHGKKASRSQAAPGIDGSHFCFAIC